MQGVVRVVVDGNILEWQLKSTFAAGTEQFLNIFHYEWGSNEPAPGLPTIGQEIIDAYAVDFVAAIQNLISVQVAFYGVKIINLSNPDEFFESDFTTPVAGAVSGDCLPPFASWGFQLNRATRTTRNGYKRFPGVAESSQVNGVATSGAISTANAIAALLGVQQDFVVASPGTLEFSLSPKIVRKDEAGELVLVNDVISASFKGIGSQNTRKFGRGS